jgi:predicted transcriptional regulator
MSKKVVSFRLSDDELHALDEVCGRLRMSRSDVVSAAIAVITKEYFLKEGTIRRRAPWFLTDSVIPEREDG